mmetsp:Transcript_1805/g.6393  ORF Transcript_1805/g.6393 Transcript_1805/m.6393 type:complete len:405 (-) Transcript_1805:297-1511(-)|eukprot:CAMPEP_0117451288 /NCGR_PEP_ID=MMETSP0759-20121206/8926_1 /TAXON_ID=63605 /ORGANISM="Percolomonas cosmopolitus, Strain WS" /LENGTH=404 /DNA_ID=CAMNT_0005243875 /DNA_START=134 /DNA_END=1348 /DNA_ORIENTATION=-
MSDETEFYDLLGLKKEDNPDFNAIRRAYKKMARKFHPDLNQDADPHKFSQINEAYEVLKDEEKRELYDKWGKEGVERGGAPGFGGGGFGSMFDIFGGGGMGQARRRGPVKGEAVRQKLQVSLEDMYNGATRKIRVTRTRICSGCKGAGATDASKVSTCSSCQGSGFVTSYQQLGPGFVTQTRRPCGQCKGEGKSVDKAYVCKVCKGQKVVSEKKTLEIHIDKGMGEGQKIVFEGEADERPGIQAGDIVFYLTQAHHDLFTRDESHLKIKKNISLAAALTGAEFTINHLDGRVLHVKSKKGEVIRPGQVKMIQGEGMPTYKNPFEKGNLFIEFTVDFPKKIPENIATELNKLLPAKGTVVKPKGKEMEEVELQEPDYTQKGGSYRESYEEDDEMEDERGTPCTAS